MESLYALKIQALWKGYRLRKQMKNLKQDYLEIYFQIENSFPNKDILNLINIFERKINSIIYLPLLDNADVKNIDKNSNAIKKNADLKTVDFMKNNLDSKDGNENPGNNFVYIGAVYDSSKINKEMCPNDDESFLNAGSVSLEQMDLNSNNLEIYNQTLILDILSQTPKPSQSPTIISNIKNSDLKQSNINEFFLDSSLTRDDNIIKQSLISLTSVSSISENPSIGIFDSLINDASCPKQNTEDTKLNDMTNIDFGQYDDNQTTDIQMGSFINSENLKSQLDHRHMSSSNNSKDSLILIDSSEDNHTISDKCNSFEVEDLNKNRENKNLDGIINIDPDKPANVNIMNKDNEFEENHNIESNNLLISKFFNFDVNDIGTNKSDTLINKALLNNGNCIVKDTTCIDIELIHSNINEKNSDKDNFLFNVIQENDININNTILIDSSDNIHNGNENLNHSSNIIDKSLREEIDERRLEIVKEIIWLQRVIDDRKEFLRKSK